jgi:hypothetical protein
VKIGLSGLFLLSLSPRTVTEFSHVPVGSFIALALVAIVAVQALCCTAIGRPDFGSSDKDVSRR